MNRQLEAFFSPSITLAWKGHFGRRADGYWPDKAADRSLLRQFMTDAGIDHRNGAVVTVKQLDLVIDAAAKYGYSVETVGHPD